MWMWTAILMGFAGSLHCAGMCGPIAMIVSGRKEGSGFPLLRSVLYNSGRVVTYIVLGALSGLAGKSVLFFIGQQWLSVGAGIIILFGLLITRTNLSFVKKMTTPVYGRLRNVLGRVLKSKRAVTMLCMGALNGLLPCGLVYAALGGAAAAGGILDGMLYMALFGASTVPLMAIISLAGAKLSPLIYRRVVKLVPLSLIVLAILLIVRGMGLGIPYISPAVEAEQVACCHVHH